MQMQMQMLHMGGRRSAAVPHLYMWVRTRTTHTANLPGFISSAQRLRWRVQRLDHFSAEKSAAGTHSVPARVALYACAVQHAQRACMRDAAWSQEGEGVADNAHNE